MNNKKIFFISVTNVLLFTLLIQISFSQVRIAGVSEGDWFKYNLSFDFDSIYNMTTEDFPFADFLIGENVTLELKKVHTGLGLTDFERLIENLEKFSTLASEVLNQDTVNLLLSETIDSVKLLKSNIHKEE